MSKAPYRAASHRSEANVDFQPPEWWRPHSSNTHLLTETRQTVQRYGAAPFMTWLDDKGKEERTLSFDELWERSRRLARKMRGDWGVETGDRVLLCYLPGLAFVEAFWSCLRLRCVAVPTYPPDPSKLQIGLKKLDLVKKSCGASLCLTEKALDSMRKALSLTHRWPAGLVWKSTDRDLKVNKGDNDAPLDAESVAFLQYTSGSTGDPKGVMLTFSNVWHNLNEIYLPAQAQHFESRGVDLSRERIVGVSWLPQFHDTGLILCIVGPFVAGYRMVNFSPLTFLKRPLLWLEALTRYGARWSAAPDFAYELCVRRLSSEVDIDLSRVVQLACGAGERCRPHQLERFREAFTDKGLRDDVWVPNYGLAEHVVGTCGCARGVILSTERPDLACCGENFQCDLRIVDPTTRKDASRGEIWISSRSVAAGYWGKPDLSRETFHARRVLDDGSESKSRYLRTGDEGFLEDGKLYITGRLKDLIIVGGKNYYPEDIEVSAQEADRVAIRPGCVAAFASSTKDEEQVVCVFEVRKNRDVDFAALSDRVVRTVGMASGLQPHRIIIIPERSIPKTTSGKVQRRQTRRLVDEKKLRVLYDSAGLINVEGSLLTNALSALKQAFPWSLGTPQPVEEEETMSRCNSATSLTALDTHEEPRPRSFSERDDVAEIEEILLSELRKVAKGRVEATTAFHELGLSSRQMVELLRQVEVALDVDLPPTVVFSCPTVRALAHEVVGLRGGSTIMAPPVVQESDGDDVGVVGWSLRLPGACDSLEQLDSILNDKVRCGTQIPATRWDWRVTDAQLSASGADDDARSRARYGAFCLGSEGFDPKTWGLRPAEAAALDPQQKLLLRQGHELLRNRYATKDELRGSSVGVMLGMMSADNVYGVEPCHAGPHQLTGNGYASCASRLSFLLDLRGPALVVDTACSGALVAARLGADAVRRNDCSTCIVGGVSLMLAPGLIHCGAARAGMLSATGRCHTFDAKADGYLRGEGCALLLLEKDASDIKWRESALQHNGQSATFTALNASSQKDLLRRALQGTTVTSVEAHGTGTRLGDPIEVSALSLLDRVCVQGAKACLGHGEPNAGAAGLLAAILSLNCTKPNGALRRLNPVVKLSSIVLPTEATLSSKGAVGVSSFGYSGIIAHAVLSGKLELNEPRMRFADDRPLTNVPPHHRNSYTSALEAALHESPALKDVTFHKNGNEGPFSVVVDGNLITVKSGTQVLLTATRCTDEATPFRPPPPATLEEVPDFYTELQEATAAPANVVGSEVIARAWVSSRGAVGACSSKDAFEACRQLACLVRRREDVGSKQWWEPTTCELIVSKGGRGPAWASVRTTARRADIGVCDASVSDTLELRGLCSVPVETGPSSLQDVKLYALRSHAIQSIEGDDAVDVLSDLPRSLPANRTGRPRYASVSVRTSSPEVALALASADNAWARLSDERGPPRAVACVALNGKSALLAGAHDAQDLALACAKCTNVRAASLCETEAAAHTPSTFDVYVSKEAPVSLRDAALRAGTKVLDASPVANADVVFVRGAWVRVVSRSAKAFAQCASLSQKTRGADVACVLWRGPAIGAEAVVRLALKCSVPRCVALATPALVVPTKAPRTVKKAATKTSTREAVARAARDALGVDDIDATASLSDLGMDSLAGAEFVADLSRRLGRAVAPALLIECDTVDSIVSALGEDEVVKEVVEEVVHEPSSRRLACAPSSKDQELLLWMLRRARTRSIKPGYAWLPPTAVGLLEGSLNVEALEGALSRVVEAHDALRSRLVEVPGANKAFVVFGVDEKPQLEKRTATTVEEAKRMAQAYHDSTPNDPYESTSLLRALLVSTPSQEHVLYLSCNHAITDGWSHQILYGELVRAYNARLQGSAAPFGHEERPYAAWLSEQPTSVNESRRKRYARCARLPAWPQLGTASVLFETGSLLRNAIAKVLPKEILDNVKRRLSPKCSLPSVVLAAYAHALGRAARGEASVVQYSHPGRTKADRRTYGQLATDANVLLDDLSPQPTVGAFAESVHRAVLEALAIPTPYADDYVACRNGREAPLPAQYNWYDRYGDVPQWSGIRRATELSLDSSSLSQKTFNVGAVYLMALVQGDGALKLVCYFNDSLYARPTILDALGDVSAFLARFAEDPSLSLPSLSAGESNGAGARE